MSLPKFRRSTRGSKLRFSRRASFLESLESRCVMAAGVLDGAFGNAGRVTADYGDFTSAVGSNDVANAVEIQANGSIVTAGRSSFVSNQGTLARYLPTGGLDPSFGIGGRVATGLLTEITDIALLANGKILAVGPTTTATPSGTVDYGVMQFNTDGSLDEDGFGSRGIAVVDFAGFVDTPRAITVSGGKILVAGSASTGAAATDFGVIRLTSGGNLDNTFDGDGRALVNFTGTADDAFDIGVDSQSRIVIVGRSNTGVGATFDFAAARLDTNGTPDATFNLDGRVTTDFNQNRDDEAFSLVIQTGDNLVLGGRASQLKIVPANLDQDFALARYDSNGDLLAGFDGDGKLTIDFNRDTSVTSNDEIGEIRDAGGGQIVAVGRAWESSTRHDVAMVRVNGVTGAKDTSLDLANGGLLFPQFWGLGDNAGNAVAVRASGYVVAGLTGGSPANYGLLSITNAGVPDAAFGNNGRVVGDFTEFVGTNDLSQASVLQPDGKTIVGGSMTNGILTFGALARYNPDGSLDTTFGNGGRLVVRDLTAVLDIAVIPGSGKIIVVGTSLDTQFTAVQLLPDGTLDIDNFGSQGVAKATFGGGANARAVALQGSTIVIAGEAVGAGDFAVARLTAAGNIDPTFDTDGRATITFFGGTDIANDVVIDSHNRILVVGSATNGGQTDFALARLDSSGVLDATFNADGRVMTDFNQNLDDVAVSVVLQGDNIVVGGRANQIKVVAPADFDFALARYSQNGDLLLGFGNGGKVTTDYTRDTNAPSDDRIGDIALDSSNRIVAVGQSWESIFAGRQKAAAARYDGVTGAIDTTVNPGTGGRLYPAFYGMGPDSLTSLSVAPNGDWIAAGTTGFGQNYGVLRLSAAGTPVAGFGAAGRAVTDFTYFLGSDDEANAVVESNGKFLVAGIAGGQAAFARYLTDGALDPSFGIGGRITTSLFNGVFDVAISGGKIIAVGPTGGGDFGILQLNDDGSLDVNNFGNRGFMSVTFFNGTDVPQAVVVDAAGKIIVAGQAQAGPGPDYDFGVTRLTSSGNLDPTFDVDGRVLIPFGSNTDIAYDVAVDSLGRIVLAGSAAVGVGGTFDFALARLESTGVLDGTFNLDGRVTTNFGQNQSDEIRRLAIQADNSIIAGGYAAQQKVIPLPADDDFALARYAPNGDLLGGFGNGGKVTTDFTRVSGNGSTDRIGDLKLTDGGQNIVVVGRSWEATPVRRNIAVARYSAVSGAIDTTLDPSTGGRLYPPYFGVSSDNANALAIASDGDWIVAGKTTDVPGSGNFGIQRLDGTGNPLPPVVVNPDMAYELVIRNGANAVITPNGLGQYPLRPGETFTIQVFVDDRRAAGATGGVSAGYVDLSYGPDLADWTSPSLTFGTDYPNTRHGTINEAAGRVEEAGAFAGAAPLGSDPDRLLYSLQGKVKTSAADGSTFLIALDPAEDLGNETLMYGYGSPVPNSKINFANLTVVVAAGWGNANLPGDVNNDGAVTNFDVQLIYDELNAGRAPKVLTGPPDALYGFPNPTPLIPGSARYWDVDGNGVLNGADAAAILAIMAAPLQLSAPAPHAAEVTTIDAAAATSIVTAVIDRLEAAGATAADTADLRAASVTVGDLEDGVLALAVGNQIIFDRDAAGQGWFVDTTPATDEEFVAGAVDAVFSSGEVDLLSVATHELGHLWGLKHSDDGDEENVMEAFLPVGTRRTPEVLWKLKRG